VAFATLSLLVLFLLLRQILAMNNLIEILNHKYESDERQPLWFLTIPAIPYISRETHIFGVTGMDPMFWVMSFVMLAIQSMVNIVTAAIIYETILKRRNNMQSYMIGYGIICPLILYWPVFILKRLDLHNITFMLCMAINTPALLFFRCMEAMHSVLPPFAYDVTKKHSENHLSRFILYYASSIQFNFDHSTDEIIFISKTEMRERCIHFVRVFLEATVLYSILIPCDYHPFPYKRPNDSWSDYFYWGNLGNNFLVAYLTGTALEAGVTGLSLMTSFMTGISTSKFNDDPMLASASPSDFWGQRWNKIVGSGLRRAVYRPLRKNKYDRSIAALATFVASGCLHEYVLLMMTFRGGKPNNPSGEPYVPQYGNQWIFFIWNGVVLLGEYSLQGTALIQFLQKTVPKPIRTTLVLLTVIPISHLFTDEYIRCSFYSDISLGFPRVVKIS
jgi:Membrane bound O-acyl transferase family